MATFPDRSKNLRDGSASCGAEAETPAGRVKSPGKATLSGRLRIGAVAVAVLLLTLSLASCGASSGGNYALYVKDNEIFFANLDREEKAYQLTSRLVDDNVPETNMVGIGDFLGLYTYVSEDGRFVLFPDRISDDDEGFSLYYKEISDPDAVSVKVDSDIVCYVVNASETLLTYRKGEEGNLYRYDIEKDYKDKIASDVRDFKVSDDGRKLCYISSDGGIYLKNADQEKVKIASDVSSLAYVAEDCSAVYYVKEHALYKQTEGEDKVKLLSDVYDVAKIYDSGEIYYVVETDADLPLTDFVVDDLADADASVVKPDDPVYPVTPSIPYPWNYETEDDYDAAYAAYREAYEAWEDECVRIKSAYDAASRAYSEKVSRDLLREGIAEHTIAVRNFSLRFYSGTEDTAVTDLLVGGYACTYATDAPVVFYEAYDPSKHKRIDLSAVEDLLDDYSCYPSEGYSIVTEMINNSAYTVSERYLAVKDVPTAVKQEKTITGFTINPSGTVAYYIDGVPDGKDSGDLYRIAIDDGVAGEAEFYDSDVCTYLCSFVGDTEFEYFKDYEDDTGELYVDQKRIDSDVYGYCVEVYPDKIFYFTDWDGKRDYGTLKVYDGEASAKIADDVSGFTVTPDGRVLYLYDFSLKYYKGELREWDDGESRKIDDDVICLLPVFTTRYKGDFPGDGY